jgi:hypothetical protein
MKKRSKSSPKYTPLISVLKERFGLPLSYIGGLALYFSTDSTAVSSLLYPPTGEMAHPVIVIPGREWLLVLGIFLIAVGFIVDFTKGLTLESKLLVFSIALFPLWHLLPTLFGR